MARATFWHPRFYELLRMQGPQWLRIHTEFPLPEQANVVDMVFEKPLSEQTTSVNSHEEKGYVLRDLWPLLSRFTVAEFKSASRPFRKPELRRLLRCAMEYSQEHKAEITTRDALTVVLFVPRINRPLREEVAYLGCTWHEIGAGYATLRGPMLYTTYIVSLDEVAELEDNDFLRLFTSTFTSGHQIHDTQARRWMAAWFQGDCDMQERDLEGYEDAVDSFLASLGPERRLAGLTADELRGHEGAVDSFLASLGPERRLAGLRAEERLAGLEAQDVIHAMSLRARDLLEALPESERRLLRALLTQTKDE